MIINRNISKKFTTVVLVGIIVILFFSFFYYKENSSIVYTHRNSSEFSTNIVVKDGCVFDKCSNECLAFGQPLRNLGIKCSEPLFYHSKGINYCEKTRKGDTCEMNLSIEAKLYIYWNNLANIQ